MDPMWIAQGVAVGMAAVAAVADHRTGLIPNWLTLPPLAAGPLAWGILHGWRGALFATISLVACGIVPYLLFRKGAAGGGDVKLLAAIGAVAGLSVGVAAQFLTLLSAGFFALAQLAWRGKLLATLKSSVFVAVNPALPERWRRTVEPEAMSTIRLGPFVLVGTLLAVAERYFLP